MENFDWTCFTKRYVIKSSVKKLYDAWTIPSKIEGWFLSKTTYYKASGEVADRNSNVVEGDQYEWNWFFYDGTERGRILKANGKDHLQFNFANNCLVDVQIKDIGEGKVIIELTQSGIPTDDQSKEQIRLGCEGGWAFYLVNLKSIAEGGLDLRNKDTGLNALKEC